jgi:hypothetical protein
MVSSEEKAVDQVHCISSSTPPNIAPHIVVSEKGEKDVVEVEVVSLPEPLSRRQRFAHFTRNLFTRESALKTADVLWKFGRFTGPGALISVAYIDPDNYQTAVSAGAEFGFKLLFMILFSNVVAVFLQVCCSIFQGRMRRRSVGSGEHMTKCFICSERLMRGR